MLGQPLYLPRAYPPGHHGLWARAGALALHIIRFVDGHELFLGQDVHGHGFHWTGGRLMVAY